jgi:membrane protease YdiL (CAAX protease family)
LFWNKSFFAGIQWRGATALRLRWRLLATALGCFALAGLDATLLPGPSNAPIDEIFRSPGAAWLMFGFGVTLAPLCEEIFFRGFLLPSLATAWDWAIERSTGKPARPLDANGHPQWSLFAIIVASVVTSLLFALMHAEQTGKSADHDQSGVVCGAHQNPLAGCQHDGPRLLQLRALLFHAGGHRRLPAPGKYVRSRD